MRIRVAPFDILESNGFDQMPCGSIEYHDENMELLVKYCKEHISKDHLIGFMQTTWAEVEPHRLDFLIKGNEAMYDAKALYES